MSLEKNRIQLFLLVFVLLLPVAVITLLPPARGTSTRSITDPFDNEDYISTLSQLEVTGGQIQIPARIMAAGWWNNSFDYSRKVTVNSSDIDDDLSSFPVYVYLDSTNINWTYVQDDLDDIRFIDSTNTTEYSYEIEGYTANVNASIWVNVPSIDDALDTEFFMYYGYSDAGNGENVAGVWDSNYVLVSHMYDYGDTSHTEDSSLSGFTMTKGAANNPAENTTSFIDTGQEFDGVSDYIDIPNNATLSPANLTLEAWLHPLSGHESYCRWIGYEDGAAPINYYYILWTSDRPLMNINGTNVYAGAGETVPLGTWSYLVGLRDNSDIEIRMNYDDIVTTKAGNYPVGTAATNDLSIGHSSFNAGYDWKGGIDEVRISNVRRSDAWIKASYESGLDDLLFYGIDEYGVIGEYLNGTFYSVNMVRGLNSTETISFYYNCKINGTENIEMQFSNDNMTWTDADGSNGWETLANRTNTIQLNALEYTGTVFYRMNFTRGDVTPILYSVTVYYDVDMSQIYYIMFGVWAVFLALSVYRPSIGTGGVSALTGLVFGLAFFSTNNLVSFALIGFSMFWLFKAMFIDTKG